MIRWPVLDREPVRLPILAGYEHSLWETLLELADLRPQEWTLIGGQVVFVHAIESDVEPVRVSSDLDVLVNARVVTGGVREFVRAIQGRGFVLAGASPEGLAHRYYRGRVSLDVLAPEGLGPGTDITTTPPGRTLQVPGGTQAIARHRIWRSPHDPGDCPKTWRSRENPKSPPRISLPTKFRLCNGHRPPVAALRRLVPPSWGDS